jgi:hypothetical protein
VRNRKAGHASPINPYAVMCRLKVTRSPELSINLFMRKNIDDFYDDA